MSDHRLPVLIIENDVGEAPRFYPYLERGGFDHETVKAHEGVPLPPFEAYSAIIATGGWMGVYEMDQPKYAYLEPEAAYLAEAVEQGVPVLGVCLGHQLLAHALGGEVVKAETPELGWLSVTLTDGGQSDPLFEGVGAQPVYLQYHFDEVVRLPEGAVRLAQSEIAPNQSFRMGDRPVWGIQFHPEYPPEYAEAIFRKYRTQLEGKGRDVAAMIATGYEVFGEQNERLFENFCRVVGSI